MVSLFKTSRYNIFIVYGVPVNDWKHIFGRRT